VICSSSRCLRFACSTFSPANSSRRSSGQPLHTTCPGIYANYANSRNYGSARVGSRPGHDRVGESPVQHLRRNRSMSNTVGLSSARRSTVMTFRLYTREQSLRHSMKAERLRKIWIGRSSWNLARMMPRMHMKCLRTCIYVAGGYDTFCDTPKNDNLGKSLST
jgi:hypothetical protein